MTWSPSDEGGLLAWYDVTDLSLSDNDAVSTWADLSGNSRTLQNAFGSTHYPTYKTGITPGGQPVVRFDGVDNFLYNATRFAFDTSASVFWFGSVATEGGDLRPLSHGGQNTSSGWNFDRMAGSLRCVFTAVVAVGNVSPSGFESYGLLIDNAATNKGVFLVDNVSQGTTTTAMGTTGTTDVLSVGGLAGVAYAEVDVCEIVYFDHVLDSTARANLQAYFEAKYLDTTPASSAILPSPAVAASGTVTSPGTATVNLPALLAAASGYVFDTSVVGGTADLTLTALEVAASGTHLSFTSGSVTVTLPAATAEAVGIGVVGSSGTAVVTLLAPTVDAEGVAHDPYEEEDPDAIDRVVLGSYQFKTRIRLVQGDLAERVDVIDGTYRFDAGSIPMRRLDAEIHYPTLDNPGLLDVAATKVTCAVVATTIDGDTSETIAQVPLWLQSIRKTVDGRGTRYQIEAVDILGRLSANGLQRPVQSASTCMRTIRRLLNNAGHHHGVLVWKDPDVTDRDAPDRAVFDGDPVYAAQEMVEQMNAIMVSIAPNAVRIMKAPRVNASATYTTDTVTSYTTVQERVPSKVLVESSSTDGTRDVTGTAGGAGSGDYGTVTARFYRPVRNSAQADRAARSLLARVKGRGYRLEQVEMIPNAAVAFGQTWKVKHSGASRGVVWSYDIPLVPNRPMVLRMRTPEDT